MLTRGGRWRDERSREAVMRPPSGAAPLFGLAAATVSPTSHDHRLAVAKADIKAMTLANTDKKI